MQFRAQCRSSLVFFLSDDLIQDLKYKDTQENKDKKKKAPKFFNVWCTALEEEQGQETTDRNLSHS